MGCNTDSVSCIDHRYLYSLSKRMRKHNSHQSRLETNKYHGKKPKQIEGNINYLKVEFKARVVVKLV